MPVITTVASMSKNGFSSIFGWTGPYWFNATDYKVDGAAGGTQGSITTLDNKVWLFGRGYGSTNRPYFVNFLDNGSVNINFTYPDQANLSDPRSDIRNVIQDSSSNTYVLWNGCDILKYDNVFTLTSSNNISCTTSLGETVNMVKDSADDLYVLTFETTYIVITKLDSSLSAIWSTKINTGFGGTNNSFRLLMDSNDNLYALCFNSATQTNYIFKILSSTGSIDWQYSLNSGQRNAIKTTCFDRANNIWMAIGIYIIQISSSGSILQNYSTTLTVGTSYTDIALTGYNNIALARADTTSAGFIDVYDINGSGICKVNLNAGSSLYTLTDIACTSDNMYVCGDTSITGALVRTVKSIIKLPAIGKITKNAVYSFTDISDNSTSYAFSGTINITAGTRPNLSSATTIVLTSTSFTTTSLTVTTSSISQSLGSTVPFNYNTPLT